MATHEKLKNELLALDKRGQIRPRDVWQWAKANKRSELHKQYPWNMQKAAEAHWDDISRGLITKYLTITTVASNKLVRSVGYVHDPRVPSGVQAYVSLTNDELDHRDAELIMLAELQRCSSAIERARGVAGILEKRHPGTAETLENLLAGLVGLTEKFQKAA